MRLHHYAFTALALVFTFALATRATAEAPTPSAEAQTIAKAVADNADWAAAAKRCPTAAMLANTAKKKITPNDCEPGDFGSCLDACVAETAGAC